MNTVHRVAADLSAESLSQLLRRLYAHVSPQRRKQLVMLFVLTIISSFAEVVSIGAVLPFLGVLTSPDLFFTNDVLSPVIHFLGIASSDDLIVPAVVGFALAALFAGVVRVLLLWAQTRLSYAIGADFCTSVYRRTLYQPYSVHVSRNTSEVISGISVKTSGVVNSTILPLLTILSGTLTLASISFTLFLIDPAVAIFAFIGFSSIYLFVILLSNKRLMAESSRISVEQTQVIKALQEGLGGIRDVLLDGAQEVCCKVYRDSDLRLRRSSGNVHIIGISPRYVIEALGMILVSALAYWLYGNQEGFKDTLPVLGAFALGAQRMLPLLQHVYSSWTSIRGNHASLGDVIRLMEQPLPAYAGAGPAQPMPFTKAVELRNLSFQYGDGVGRVLDSIDLTIPKGGLIGIVGSTGGGKSTLLDILMALLEPTGGELVVDGVPVTESNRRSWQANIGHVPQTIFLTDATIAENIALGVPAEKIDHRRVRWAAKTAQLNKVIEAWPEGYSTTVGERGVRISGGQRQRTGIARALYKQADVLIFDEATSALDSATESLVMEQISALPKDMTIVMVAHRLTTLKGCDRIIELRDGKVLRSGTYAELYADR